MARSILIVEDEAFTRQLVSVALQGAGYQVTAVADGAAALAAVRTDGHDLALLDVRLPGVDGWELCRQIREIRDLPVIFLTALGDDEDVVRGLRSGGDDYLTKPFSPVVLVAHVEAVLRRAGRPTSRVVELPGLTIDLASGVVKRENQPVHLTATEFRLLTVLARRPGVMISPQQLLSEAQGYSLTEREARPLAKTHIRNLRMKIEARPDQPRHIMTVRGIGYMLNADPDMSASGASASGRSAGAIGRQP